MFVAVASALAGPSTQSSTKPEKQSKRCSSIDPERGEALPILQVVAIKAKPLLACGDPLTGLDRRLHLPYFLSRVYVEGQGSAQNGLHEYLYRARRPLGIVRSLLLKVRLTALLSHAAGCVTELHVCGRPLPHEFVRPQLV